MELAEFIKSEWAVLKKAPLSFSLLLVIGITTGVGIGSWHYSERLDAKDGEIHRYRVALGIDQASKGALVELSNEELALKAQSIVGKLREYLAMVSSNNQAVDKRLADGKIDQAEATKEKTDDLENVDHQFDVSLAADVYNVENELRSRLDPSALAHITRAPAFMFGSDPRSRVTMADMFRGTPAEIQMLGPLANEMEQMAKLLPADSPTK